MAIIRGDWMDNRYDPVFNSGLQGTGDDDFIYGYEGRDDLFGDGGDDWLDGGSGADRMEGGDGNDTYIVDNTGDKVIEAESGTVNANPGNDTVKASINYVLPAGVENLLLIGSAIRGDGNSLDNFILGNFGWNDLYGHGGDDELMGGDGDDRLYGGTGEDTLSGGQDRDTLYGGDQNDVLYGDSGNDTLRGENGGDYLHGGTGADAMYGGVGNDEYAVDNAGDVVVEYAGEGVDHVESTVSYTLTANVENLTLTGTAANGTGNSSANDITGNGLNNTLNGGLGADTLRGAGGQDSFVFNTTLGKGNIDMVADFSTVDDTIILDDAVFTALAIQGVDMRTLSSAEFRVGSAAMDSSDRIIYNWNTGGLFYDPDGIGAQTAVQFASIGAGYSSITNEDFVII
jgi:Ca2+-binding RTX toxin-like protein